MNPEPEQFYILSLNHGPANGRCLFWKEDGAGYTTNLNEAGKWSRSRVLSNPKKYDNDRNRPVPCIEIDKFFSSTEVFVGYEHLSEISNREYIQNRYRIKLCSTNS